MARSVGGYVANCSDYAASTGGDAAIAAIAPMEGDAYDGEILVKYWWNTGEIMVMMLMMVKYIVLHSHFPVKLWVYDWYCCAYQATTLHWTAEKDSLF